MPGYVTHYIFGRDMYEKLNDPVLKNNLYKNRAVYALGHQGPDIFFYYLPAYVLHGHNLGDMAHTENTGAFYAALLESRSIFKKPEDLQIDISGSEYWEWTDKAEFTDTFQEASDCGLAAGRSRCGGTLGDGSFALFLPEEFHKPSCKNGSHTHVRKAVIKIEM